MGDWLRFPLGCLCLLDGCDVGQVLQATYSQLVLDEMFQGDVAGWDFLVDEPWHGCRPHGFEFKCCDPLDDVDANGGDSDLKDGVRVFKITCSKSLQGCAKLSQRNENRLSILWGGVDENIQVAGCAGLGMHGESVAAYDHISNFAGIQRGQEIF